MIRKTLFWVHLVFGVVASIPLSVMAVTGVVLSFEPQIVSWIESDFRSSPSVAGSVPVDLDSVVSSARRVGSGKPTSVQISSDPAQPVQVAFGRESVVWVDAGTGIVVGQTTLVHSGFALVERVHRWLGARGVGSAVTGVSVVLLLLLSLSGIFLWWPRSLSAAKHVLWPRPGLRGRARDWQWHNSLGVLALPLLLVLSLTGTVMSWHWAEAALYRVAGSEAPSREGGHAKPASAPMKAEVVESEAPRAASWRAWVQTAEEHAPGSWSTLNVRAPAKPSAGAQVMVRSADGDLAKGGTVMLRPDGSFERLQPFRSDLGTRLRFQMKPLHTGELFGFPGQVAMALASVCGMLLAWTGLALSLRRWKRHRTTNPV